ncbi:hypothetical protein, partial [Thiolapillus sp.]|uniref:hypothetical protein n=1 Tax=Thiolapillus sp. TaxID=2017437 RepID=UPI003AF6C017
PSQNLHPNNSPDLFKSDTGDDRLPQNPVGGGVGKYDKVELRKRSQKGNKARLTILLNETFVLPKPKIMRPDNWLPLNPGDLLGRAGCGKSARPVL